MKRRDKTNYYLDLAEVVCERSTCLRKQFGAIIVKDDIVLATGYNGAPRKRKNCSDLKFCLREKHEIPRGERYELCRSVHAEANAIINLSKSEMKDATLYLVGIDASTGNYSEQISSCAMCKKIIINSGIEKVVVRDTKNEYREIEVEDWITNDETLTISLGY